MRRNWRRIAPLVIGLLAIAAMLLVRGILPDPFERLRLSGFDTLQRLHPWPMSETPVVVVDIDDESLKRLGQWPWPRAVIAALVRRLQDAEAKAIAFDMVFAEPDRTSPATQSRAWATQFGWTAPPTATTPLPDYDEDLAAALRRGRVVLGFGLVGQANAARPLLGAGFATIGGDPAATVRVFPGAVPNLPGLEAAAAGNGSFSIVGGSDQTIRSLPLLAALNGQVVPSLALEALRVAEDADTIGVRAEHDGGPQGAVIGYTVRVGDLDLPLDAGGALDLHHGPPRAQPSIPAWRLLDAGQAAVTDAAIRGKIVLVGTSAAGLSDLRATPLNPLEPGVNLHARAIAQGMAQHFIRRPVWATGAEFLLAGVLPALAVALVSLCSFRLALPATLAMAGGLLAGSWGLFVGAGLLIDPSLVLITLLVSGVATGLARYFVAERDASRLRSAFTHYLSADLVAALARDPDRLKLGGEMRDMTFLFTDLQGFTALMESADPEQTVTLLNDYLDGLCRIAIEHGGTVDKIVGDALHVMFNAPLDQPDHADRAVRCALAIDGFAQGYAAAQRAAGIAFGETRIGVNTGKALVGNFGGSRRFDYTAHGDAINTAARLEAANKTLGTRVCVAGTTAAAVTAIAFLPVGTLMLKGKSRGVEVFVPVLAREGAGDWTGPYREAFARMAADDEAGRHSLLALHERHPEEPVLALHARRIRAGERSVRMAA